MSAQVLLGTCDAAVPSSDELTALTNKIGGIPNVYDESLNAPTCPLCGRTMSLIVQLYCPLGGSPYHRTLYIFACVTKTCWNKQDSWCVIRCQQLAVENGSVSSSNNLGTEEWCDSADDWGDPAPTHNGGKIIAPEEWGVAQDDWGVAQDDWGVAQDDWGVAQNEDICKSYKSESEKLNLTSKSWASCSLDREKKENVYDKLALTEEIRSDSSPDLDLSHFKEMNIDDVEDSESEVSILPHCLADDMTMESYDGRTLHSVLRCGNSEDTNSAELIIDSALGCFKSFYLSAFEEPHGGVQSDQHIRKLMNEYSQREGIDFNKMREDFDSSTGERYEKTQVQHGDNTFHKFMKRVSLCPEQCLRYSWCGKPLLMAKLSTSQAPGNCSCGAERVFEVQLMPALVNILKLEGHEQGSTPLEFGTVLIFSCSQSCWKEGATYKKEAVIVQADPDQHLFK